MKFWGRGRSEPGIDNFNAQKIRGEGKRNLLIKYGHRIISLHTFWVSIDVMDLSWVVFGHCTVHYTLHYTSGEQPGPGSPVLTLARTQLNIV